MNKLIHIVLVAFVLAIVPNGVHAGSPIQQCPNENFEDLHERIAITPCSENRCQLKHGTDTKVEFKFKPNYEVASLENIVYANIMGISIPFVGINGTSACSHITRADTGEPAPCPLLPGVNYFYTNNFPIEKYYPTIHFKVHWSLTDSGNNKNVICFEVPAVIITSKGKKTDS